MSRFPVSSEKEAALLQRMESLGIRESDLDEQFIRSSGKGGQNVNKVSTCVYLRHRSSGIEVKCQRERSQGLNRFVARRLLCDRIEAEREGVVSAQRAQAAKIRKQKQRRSRRQREKLLDDKSHRGALKKMRGAPHNSD